MWPDSRGAVFPRLPPAPGCLLTSAPAPSRAGPPASLLGTALLGTALLGIDLLGRSDPSPDTPLPPASDSPSPGTQCLDQDPQTGWGRPSTWPRPGPVRPDQTHLLGHWNLGPFARGVRWARDLPYTCRPVTERPAMTAPGRSPASVSPRRTVPSCRRESRGGVRARLSWDGEGFGAPVCDSTGLPRAPIEGRGVQSDGPWSPCTFCEQRAR